MALESSPAKGGIPADDTETLKNVQIIGVIKASQLEGQDLLLVPISSLDYWKDTTTSSLGSDFKVLLHHDGTKTDQDMYPAMDASKIDLITCETDV